MYADASDGAALEGKMRAAARATTGLLASLLWSIPMLGCASPSNNLASMMTSEQEQAVCKFIQQGTGQEQPCCTDLSDASVSPYTTALRLGVNYWSENSAHTDANYDASMFTCQHVYNATANTWLNNTSPANFRKCHMDIVAQWTRTGARFATGAGKIIAAGTVKGLRQPAAFESLILKAYETSTPSYRCVRPAYTPVLEAKLGNKCVNMEEALAIIAKYAGAGKLVYPNPEPNKNIPEVGNVCDYVVCVLYMCLCLCLCLCWCFRLCSKHNPIWSPTRIFNR